MDASRRAYVVKDKTSRRAAERIGARSKRRSRREERPCLRTSDQWEWIIARERQPADVMERETVCSCQAGKPRAFNMFEALH